MLNVSILSQAVEEICAGRRIHLFGVGASGLLAMDFLYKSSRIGIPATYHADAHTNLATASLLGPEDIVIAISYSGETRETVLAAKAAKERGISKVRLCCDHYNIASAKTIQSNGGVLEDEMFDSSDGMLTQQYWIENR